MYTPKHFRVTDPKAAHDLVRQHPFGLLIAQTSQAMEASHLPFRLQVQAGQPDKLETHMARANPLWKNLEPDVAVLVVFTGPHAYISPTWYSDSRGSVPTWNYQAVHGYGKARPMHETQLHRHLMASAVFYEGREKSSWRLEHMDEDLYRRRLQAIIGLEIVVDRWQTKFKLSQNRTSKDRQSLIANLSQQGSGATIALADLMVQQEDKQSE